MELPPWLKIENLIGNLNFSGWFKRENKKQVGNEVHIGKVEIQQNYIQMLPTNVDEAPKRINADKIFDEKVEIEEPEEFEFTVEEKYLILKINKVHMLCGCQGFDFEKNYKQALNHIRNKPSKDWYECAAKDMVLVKENIDLFCVFEEIKDPERREMFEWYKKSINYLYKIIQKIKHSNKRGNIEEEFLSSYDKKLNNDVMTSEKYEDIFNQFQNLLIDLFKKFKLKDE